MWSPYPRQAYSAAMTRHHSSHDTPGPAVTFTCVECSGTCHLISYAPEEGFEPGDVIAYRCGDCDRRFDLVVTAEDCDEAGDGDWAD